MQLRLLSILMLTIICSACNSQAPPSESTRLYQDELQSYWHNNEAEITSYKLMQARYGELHEGTAVLVFVTEHFSPSQFVKPDKVESDDLPILKLNFTKKFNTGIYPYSMMNSTFFPFQNGSHSLKISSSSQEWCGHTFMELKNKKNFKIKILSYFDGESRDEITLKKSLLEDDIWSIIRLDPDKLPTGELKMIPSFFFLRLLHKKTAAYTAIASKTNNQATTTYELKYPELDRSLAITFEKSFPFRILSWEESSYSGWGVNRKQLTTTAERIQTINSAYWTHHSNKDLKLRAKLGLE